MTTHPDDTVPWRMAFPALSETERPGRMLRAARTKEGVTQAQLAKRTGIPRGQLVQIEAGLRLLEKAQAQRGAAILKIDARLLLFQPTPQ